MTKDVASPKIGNKIWYWIKRILLSDLLYIFIMISVILLFIFLTRSYKIDDDKDFFTAIFSIQASVSVLGIAILSLLASSVRETYLGMKISTFYVSHYSNIFRSHLIIILQMCFIIVGLFLLNTQYYTLVPYLLLISVFLTIKHITIIFRIFKGFRIITEDIENYYRKGVKKANRIKFIDILKQIETADDYTSIYSNKRHSESVLLFYISLHELVISKDFPIKESFEDSFVKVVKNHITNNQVNTLAFVIPIMSISVKKYTIANKYCGSFSLKLFDALSEYLEKSSDDELLQFVHISKFYAEYLKNIKLNKEDNFENTFLEIDIIPIRYLNKVFTKNKSFKGISNLTIDSFIDNFSMLEYENLNLLPVYREFTIWLLLNDVDNYVINSNLNRLLRDSYTEEYNYGFNNKIHILSILIFFYQIMFVENGGLEKFIQLKPKIMDIVNSNRDLNSIIYDIMYDNEYLSNFHEEMIERMISRWEYSIIGESTMREYINDKSIAEFVFLMLINSSNSTSDITNVMFLNKIPAYLLSSLFTSNEEDFCKNKIRNFQTIFLKKDFENGIELVEKTQTVIDELMKKEYMFRNSTEITNEYENNYVINNSEKLRQSLPTKLVPFIGRVNTDVKTKVFEAQTIDDLENSMVIFDHFTIENIKEKLLRKILKEDIASRVHNRLIISNKETTINEILSPISRVRVNTDTLIGFRDRFFGYKNYNDFRNYVRGVKYKINLNFGHNFIFAIDSSLVKVQIIEIEIEIIKVDLEEYITKKMITKNQNDEYLIEIGHNSHVSFTQAELKSYVERRIRKIDYKVYYKVQIDKKKIGNYFTFQD